jgi:Domain of unknown function (DUF4440)
MGDSRVEIEALALGTMRAWVANDAKAMKKLTHRDYVMIVGTMPLQMLDRPSYLAAMERGFACTRFAFREVFANPYGKTASLVAGAELELALGPKVWAVPDHRCVAQGDDWRVETGRTQPRPARTG